jgi:DNA repair exonuclease SbcCD ATPase subunit
MHLGVVPITVDHKLSAKRLFNRKELQALQADLPDYLSQQGFVVQKGRSARRHLDEAAYKKQQAELRAERGREQAAQAEKTLAEKTGKLTRRATQEIKLREHQAKLVKQAQTLAGKIEQGAETLGTLQQETAREKKALAQVRAAANKVRLDTYAIDRIPVEVKKTGILRNGPQIVSVRLEDWNNIKTLAKSSAAHRDEFERSQRDFENLLRNNTQLEKRYDETYRENQRLKRLIEQKDRLIGQLRQAAEMLFERGREVFGRMMGYVKGRFYLGEQDVQPEEEKGFKQGRREQEEAFEASEREYEQEQRRSERYRGPEL